MRDFIERVVNSHDLDAIEQAVNEMVSPDYVGTGSDWHHLASDRESLLAFYRRQAIERPDWHIDIQETMEVGEYVVTRALAGGKLAFGEDGEARPPGYPTAVEWLQVTRIVDGKTVEGHLVTWVVTARA